MSSQPTVYDRMVQVTVIDKEGRRHMFRGLEGQKLVDVLVANEDQLGQENVLCLSPEGRGVMECHVKVPNEYLTAIPAPNEDEQKALTQIAEGMTANSRLASKITLSKGLNDMLVALGDNYPWKTL